MPVRPSAWVLYFILAGVMFLILWQLDAETEIAPWYVLWAFALPLLYVGHYNLGDGWNPASVPNPTPHEYFGLVCYLLGSAFLYWPIVRWLKTITFDIQF